MTTIRSVDAAGEPVPEGQTRFWGEIAFYFARKIARADFQRGDLAGLRRMDPDAPDTAPFWRLLAEQDLLGIPIVENKWALILHGIALMTPTHSGEGSPQSAHDGSVHVGRALFLGAESQRRDSPFYSETRLNRLLTAQGPMLRTLLARMFRMLGASDVSFNWREMASFILNEGYDDEATERSRRRIAKEYYQAERRSSRVSEE